MTIAAALVAAQKGPVEAAIEMGLERNYLRDFLEGKKRSLKIEVTMQISETFGIPFKQLVPSKEKQTRRAISA